jgi:hypothetical protein
MGVPDLIAERGVEPDDALVLLGQPEQEREGLAPPGNVVGRLAR